MLIDKIAFALMTIATFVVVGACFYLNLTAYDIPAVYAIGAIFAALWLYRATVFYKELKAH